MVISGTGGPRENMIAGRTGVVCHHDDPVQWAAIVVATLRDEVNHARMRTAAREYALTRTWEAAMQPLYRAYREARLHSAEPTPGDAVHAAVHGV